MTITETLRLAQKAHGDFESIYLGGEHDAVWPGFYAAFLLGRFGPILGATELANVLRATPVVPGVDWHAAAANNVCAALAQPIAREFRP